MGENIESNNNEIAKKYLYLSEKANKLFAGLRDLSPFGQQWRPFFQNTYDAFKQLWNFQLKNREALQNSGYVFQRWEIGEIASRIGQLYYHYYLRTSSIEYLEESFIYYDAIRTRGYFKNVTNISVVIKKLRYFARFIVVSLLLCKTELLQELVGRLTGLVNDYTLNPSQTQDSSEWQLVLREITLFIQADKPLLITSNEKDYVPKSRRSDINLLTYQPENQTHKIKLSFSILVGSHKHQVKFSELTLDMFRMILTLEPSVKNNDFIIQKHLLYRPSVKQLINYISSLSIELEENSALLLYISTDGDKQCSPKEKLIGYENGGLCLGNRDNLETTSPDKCFYPGDLISFTRYPLFIVLDSDNSNSFLNVPNIFGAPMVIICSPQKQPEQIPEASQTGSLFTFFMHDPLDALCFSVFKTEIDSQTYNQCNTKLNQWFIDMINTLTQSQDLPENYRYFMGDPYLRLLIVRYIFCYGVLSMHQLFIPDDDDGNYLPSSSPSIPESILDHPSLNEIVKEIAQILDVINLFLFKTKGKS